VILVYDVSRWGRFQDADESAYYEYVCRRAGIQVAYCAEQFENDGSPVSTIVKGVKRAMAGEYSRELSAKVFAGQCRLIELGFRRGGPAGYGLRRVLIDQHGIMKGELQRGEHKSLQTDRVILMPGPESEIRIINLIYNWFIDGSLNEYEIAARLNGMRVRTNLDREWTRATVREVLTNEKYIGNNVYNRVPFKLKKMRVVNTPDVWIRKEGAFQSIVPSEVFYTAQGIMRARARRYSNEELIERLRNLYRNRGFLSGPAIDETDGMPSSFVYMSRFGSLIRAYQTVGFTPGRDYRYLETNRFLRQLHPEIIAQTEKKIADLGGTVQRDPATDMLTVNHEFTTCLVLARCQTHETGRHRWKVRFDTSLLPDITVAIRLDHANSGALDYYLLPKSNARSQWSARQGLRSSDSYSSWVRFGNCSPMRTSSIYCVRKGWQRCPNISPSASGPAGASHDRRDARVHSRAAIDPNSVHPTVAQDAGDHHRYPQVQTDQGVNQGDRTDRTAVCNASAPEYGPTRAARWTPSPRCDAGTRIGRSVVPDRD
jgi:hypothetical protein